MDGIADYNEVDDDLPSGVPNFNDKEICYVDFLGVDDILSNSHNNDCDEFYVVKENHMFTRQTTTNPFLSIFMAYGREKVRGKRSKPHVSQGGIWAFKIIIIVYQ